MKKLVAFAVACLMALSLVNVAFAADDVYVEITVTNGDPNFPVNVAGGIDPAKAPYAVIRYNQEPDSGATKGQIFPSPATGPNSTYDYVADGNWNTVVVDLTSLANESWASGFRFDVLQGSDPGQSIKIAWVAFTDAKPGDDFDPSTAAYYFDAVALYKAANGVGKSGIESAELYGSDVELDTLVEFSTRLEPSYPRNVAKFDGGYAMKITIPEGKSLKSITWIAAPTWGATDPTTSSLRVEVYEWFTDYETSITGTKLDEVNIDEHTDNTDLTVNFNANLSGHTYLINFVSTGESYIGFWDGEMAAGMESYGVLSFESGKEVDWIPYCAFALGTSTGEGASGAPGSASGNNPGGNNPGGNPTTGDASVMSFAVAAVLALGVLVILRKRNAA